MSSFSYNVAAGTEINAPLVFAPTAVVCSNYSPYYLYFPDGLAFCPPWTTGAIIPLAHATQARATWLQTPFGNQTIGAAIPGVNYTASLVFSDDPSLTLAGGTLISIPQDTRSAVFTAAPGATLNTGALPFTAFGLRVDNYTGTWYQIGTTGILVPPFTTGFTLDLLPPVTSLTLSPATPPYGSNANTGTTLVATLYPVATGNSPGTSTQVATDSFYTAPLAVTLRGLNLFALMSSVPIDLVQLQFQAPTVAQTYQLARFTNVPVGSPFTPTPTDPSYAPFSTYGSLLQPFSNTTPVMGTSTAVSATNTVTGALPAGVVAGDILLVIVGLNTQVSAPVAPAGFTSQGQLLSVNGSELVYSKLAVGNESGTNVTVSWTTVANGNMQTLRVPNLSSATATNFTTANNAGTANSTPPAITPTGNPTSWVIAVGLIQTAGAVTGSATPAGNTTFFNVAGAGTTKHFGQYNGSDGTILTWGATTHAAANNAWVTVAFPLNPLTLTGLTVIGTTASIPITVNTTVNIEQTFGAKVFSGSAGGLAIIAPAEVTMTLLLTLRKPAI